MGEANVHGGALGPTEDELAFYDALKPNDTAVQVRSDLRLRNVARKLVDTVRNPVGIDRTLREQVRAYLRRLVKRIQRKHGYPPDKLEKAMRTVLNRAEMLSAGWAVRHCVSRADRASPRPDAVKGWGIGSCRDSELPDPNATVMLSGAIWYHIDHRRRFGIRCPGINSPDTNPNDVAPTTRIA